MQIAGKNIRLGIMLRREHPPTDLPRFARAVESANYDELWVVEDCFYGSGIAPAATALALTKRITVGLGIMPAVVRNPVFAAMEIATLAGMYPGRFLPGFGHGVTEWMQQIGAFPRSQVAALEETSITVRQLLKGEMVNFEGKHVHLRDCQLLFPPAQVPPVSLGVRSEKSLRASGRSADGTILAEFAAPDYVKWARQQIAQGQAEAGISTHHRMTVFVMAYFGTDAETLAAARARVAGAIYRERIDPQIDPLDILAEASAMREQGTLEAEMPDEWVRQLVLVGSPEECAEQIAKYADAGVDSLVLVPPTDASLAMPEEIASKLINYLKDA